MLLTWTDFAWEQYEELQEKDKSLCNRALDMNLEYEKLQMSNPWFDENYRIEQSRLFISSLALRKQFLYENRKNIKAAVHIWKTQNKYLENKLL